MSTGKLNTEGIMLFEQPFAKVNSARYFFILCILSA